MALAEATTDQKRRNPAAIQKFGIAADAHQPANGCQYGQSRERYRHRPRRLVWDVSAMSMLVSALAGGGVGPWVPYQIFAVGWVGVAAGLAGGWRTGSAHSETGTSRTPL